MGLDFFGVEISGRIVIPSRTGIRTSYDLWMGNDSDSLLPEGLRDLSYVQDVAVQVGLGLNSKVTLNMNLPVDVGRELVHSPLLSWGASELKVQVGYSTGDQDQKLSVEYGGLVMKPEVRFGTSITVTLSALGVGYGLALSNATEPTRWDPGTSPWEAVRDMLQKDKYYRRALDDESTIFPDFTINQRLKTNPAAHPFFRPVIGRKASTPDEQSNAEKLKADIDAQLAKKQITKAEADNQKQQIDKSIRTKDEQLPIVKGARSAWWFIRETIKRFGLELVIRGNKILIREPKVWKNDQPKYVFSYHGNIQTDLEVPVLPILDFYSPSAYVWLGPGIGGVLQSDISPDNKKEISRLVTASDPRQEALDLVKRITTFGQAKTVIEQVKNVTRTGDGEYSGGSSEYDAYSVMPGSPDGAVGGQVLNELRSLNHNRGIQADITTLGLPAILPADVIGVTGIAPEGTKEDDAWFDGKYGVMVAEHNFGTSGTSTKIKCVKNFFPKQLIDGVEATGDTVNKSSVPSDSSQDAGSTDTFSVFPRSE